MQLLPVCGWSSQTPLGAEQNGSVDGAVPAWIGDSETVASTVNIITNETPNFFINSDNYLRYKAFLTPGQIALLNKYPESFNLPIYKTYRTHIAPEWIYEATKKNAKDVRLVENGNGITNVWPGTPFPNPRSGIEVIWNHLLHWRGVSLNFNLFEATVHSAGTHSIVQSEIFLAMPFYQKGRDAIRDNGKMIYYMNFVNQPASLAGGGLLVHENLNSKAVPRRAWVYLADQNRVRRLPKFEHDTALFNSENLRVVDEVDLFSGSPSLYNWKIIEKKEVFVPYNSTKLEISVIADRNALLTRNHLAPNVTRFERHRVWVVEGNLKKGSLHIYPKRTIYIDEDSWIAVMADMYDRNGELWRTSMSHTRFRSNMKGIWKVADVHHDLKSSKYYIQSLAEPIPNSHDFYTMPPLSDFSPSSLRRASKR